EVRVEDIMLALQMFPERSWKRARAAWNGFFRWAVNFEHCLRNPLDKLPRVKEEPERVLAVFSPIEQWSLINRARYTHFPDLDAARMMLLLDSGGRKAEMMRLVLEDIYLRERYVKLRGKGDKEREVPLNEETVLGIERALAFPIRGLKRGLEVNDHLWFGYYCRGERFLGVCDPKREISPRGFHDWWARIAKPALGDKYRKLHMTRHTYATEVADATGGNAFAIKDLLGHESIATSQRYVHASRQRLRKVADQLAAYRRRMLEELEERGEL